MNYWYLRALGEHIAKQLMADLAAGAIPHIGIDTIRPRCESRVEDPADLDLLLGLVCRFVVEQVLAEEENRAHTGST